MSAATTTVALLERAGYDIRGSRATCPHCSPDHRRRSLTVAVRGELFFCHRCKRGGSVRGVARRQGVKLPPPRIRRADIPKAEFRSWLANKMTELSKLEYRARRRASLAVQVLQRWPDEESAWDALAEWYHARSMFSTFWESTSDKVGRYWLYRTWRAHAR